MSHCCKPFVTFHETSGVGAAVSPAYLLSDQSAAISCRIRMFTTRPCSRKINLEKAQAPLDVVRRAYRGARQMPVVNVTGDYTD
jgi:hypothetical protein